MASVGRRSYPSSTTATLSSLGHAKRPANENAVGAGVAASGKVLAAASPTKARKRAALGNITNVTGRNATQPSGTKGRAREIAVKAPLPKKTSVSHARDTSLRKNPSVTVVSSTVKPSSVVRGKEPTVAGNDDATVGNVDGVAPSSKNLSPDDSVKGSVSLDESMSTCGSIRSPDFEYIDNADSSAIASLGRRANVNLHISDDSTEGYKWKKEAVMGLEKDTVAVDIDNNHDDPQLCSTLACDIYKHLLETETRKRPSANYIEVVQKDITSTMRSILIDWLVEVAEEYRLVPDTLYLTVNYIDRYLSGNEVNRQRLQLLGVACMLIASKYEEICAPQVEEFCYITDNTYLAEEVLEMESAVLKHLKFEMSATTTKCFLRRFIRAAQWADESPSLQFEFLANYVAEVTLLEYSFLSYSPSTIAASAVFLSKFILHPTKRPWNATLDHYTLYKPSQISNCVTAMHLLIRSSPNSSLPAIREKYSQHKYKFVAKKYCPPTIPQEFFQDTCK